ncbi:MAG: Spermidine synthase [candidate division BRC1 bacterium ADurb.BinA364]|nr:MAG: Spermidine synthase [candidate division BRC1 bacterium ADurb.BinA364]
MIERFNMQLMSEYENFLQRAKSSELLYYRDGLAGTVTARHYPPPSNVYTLAVNGKPEASNTMGDMPTQLLCGHLGPLLRPGPKQAMVIGLGGGVTLASVLKHRSVERVDMVEINNAVVEAVKLHFGEINDHALDDPRVNLILADGRNHVTLTDRTYDLMVSVPSNPWMAGIANLFTTEFFTLCRDRLSENGVMCQWLHTYNLSFADYMMVIRTFMEVMPHALLWESSEGDYMMIGSKQPLEIDYDRLKRDLETGDAAQHLSQAALNDIRHFIPGFIARKEDLASMPEYQNAEENIDNSCRLEFSAPRVYYEYARQVRNGDIAGIRQNPAELFAAGAPPEFLESIGRIKSARLLTADAARLMREDKPAEAAVQLAKSIELYEYDPQTRNFAMEIYKNMAVQAYPRDRARALQWLTKAIESYEKVRFAQDVQSLQRLYFDAMLISRDLGQMEFSEHCRKQLLDWGGEELLELHARQAEKIGKFAAQARKK